MTIDKMKLAPRILRLVKAIAWICILIAVLWYIKTGTPDALLAIFTGLATLLTLLFLNDINAISFDHQTNEKLNQQAMLKLVNNYWGLSKNEGLVPNLPPIELCLVERQDIVNRPFDVFLDKNSNNLVTPLNSKLFDYFITKGKTLLILGNPGMGKTTLMRRLVTDSILLAEKDTSFQIPIVFHLSTWNNGQQSLNSWLLDELKARYGVDRKIGQKWFDNQSVIVFLDGLDEITTNNRLSCFSAINNFRQNNALTPIVVCCRSEEYLASGTTLNIPNALEIQPLTMDQVDNWLKKGGQKYSVIRNIINDDLNLHEILQTPLMLGIFLASIQDEHNLSRKTNPVEYRLNDLFDIYIEKMFRRRNYSQQFSQSQTVYWLSKLAQQMSEHSLSVFTIETLQPNWLKSKKAKLLYSIFSRGFIGLLSGILGAVILWLFLVFPVFISISLESFLFLLFGLFASLVLLIGIVIIFGLVGGLIGFLVGMIFHTKFAQEKITYIDGVVWYWKLALDETKRRFNLWQKQIRSPGILNDFPIAYIRLLILLVSSLPAGFHSTVLEYRLDTRGIVKQSAKNGLVASFMGFLYGMFFTLAVWTFLTFISFVRDIILQQNTMFFWLLTPLALGCIPGIFTSLLAFFRYGGTPVIQNFSIRLALRLTNEFPWNYSVFFNHAKELIILRREGGGFAFIHKTFQEHFSKKNLQHHS